MERPPGAAAGEAGQQLGGEQHERRSECEGDREHDDVEAARAAGDEELGVVGEEVEQGLRHRQRAQAEQLRRGHEQLVPRVIAYGAAPVAHHEREAGNADRDAGDADELLLPAEDRGVAEPADGERDGEQGGACGE